MMAETEKQIVKNMADAIDALPDDKKQYFIGFAEGVAAMATQVKAKADPADSAAAR